MCESHWVTLTTFSPDQSPRILSVPLLSRRQIQGRRPKPTVIIISHWEVSDYHNSPTMAKTVPCSDVPSVMAFLAVQTYRPLSSVEKVWRLSTPLSGWPDATGCPSSVHVKRAGGSESDMQVRRTVCPTNTSPPPTHSFGVSLVSTGVSGPSGLVMIRGHHYQPQKHFGHRGKSAFPKQLTQMYGLYMRLEMFIILSILGLSRLLWRKTFWWAHSGLVSILLS